MKYKTAIELLNLMENEKRGDSEIFLKKYANIPIKLREDIIAVIEGKPVTWNVAYLEIKENTDYGKKILNVLKEIGTL